MTYTVHWNARYLVRPRVDSKSQRRFDAGNLNIHHLNKRGEYSARLQEGGLNFQTFQLIYLTYAKRPIRIKALLPWRNSATKHSQQALSYDQILRALVSRTKRAPRKSQRLADELLHLRILAALLVGCRVGICIWSTSEGGGWAVPTVKSS